MAGSNLYSELEKTDNNLTSEFNEAQFQINRIGLLWDKFDLAMLNGNFFEHNGAIWLTDRIFGNLSSDANRLLKNNKEDYSKQIQKINSYIFKNQGNDKLIYALLQRKEKILRELQDAAGKGGRYRETDNDGM